MIQSVRLKNFKGHRETEIPLGRLTMLVGDNASGKTSVLEALAILSSLGGPRETWLHGKRAPIDLMRRGVAEGITIETISNRRETCAVTLAPRHRGNSISHWVGLLNRNGVRTQEESFDPAITPVPIWNDVREVVGKAVLYRLDAEKISESAYSDIPEAAVANDGTDTAVVLAALKLGDDEAFQRIESSLHQLVPSIERIRIRRATVHRSQGDSVAGHKIYFDFAGAADVPAHGASQGTLILLALLTILHGPNRPQLILLDDLEHALHPRAQIELVKMLKELLALKEFSDLQIIATTHSPYALDALAPEDVHVFASRPDGTVASKRLSQHPEAARTKGSLSAGELWSLDPERKWVLGE